MAMKDIYTTLKQVFRERVEAYSALEKTVRVEGGGQSGHEVKLTAEYEGALGECWTSSPADFTGTLGEVLALDIENKPAERSIYLAVLNAVMNKYEMADDCLSCNDSDKERCAAQILQRYKRNNGKVNFLLVGYQPQMAKALATHFPLRVLDLDPENIGKEAHGVTIEDGAAAYADASRWADVILCTGSALANGTIFDYIKLPKDVSFYGTTIAAAARILDIRRVCPFGRNQ